MTARLGAPNEFCWMDLKTHDLPGTAAYFSAVLGWRFAVAVDDPRRPVAISVGGHRIGTVSDLANPIYPAGTPPHIAYYLKVDDVDRRVETAADSGAQVVLAPFDAGGQGRIATLLDPDGAAFSLWQPYDFAGWDLQDQAACAPWRMVLACQEPDRARHFYRERLGTALVHADFVAADPSDPSTSQWELAIAADDLDAITARARDHGPEPTRSEHTGRPSLRVSERPAPATVALTAPCGRRWQA